MIRFELFILQFAGAHSDQSFQGFFPLADGIDAVAHKGIKPSKKQHNTSDDKGPGFVKSLLDDHFNFHFAGLIQAASRDGFDLKYIIPSGNIAVHHHVLIVERSPVALVIFQLVGEAVLVGFAVVGYRKAQRKIAVAAPQKNRTLFVDPGCSGENGVSFPTVMGKFGKKHWCLVSFTFLAPKLRPRVKSIDPVQAPKIKATIAGS